MSNSTYLVNDNDADACISTFYRLRMSLALSRVYIYPNRRDCVVRSHIAQSYHPGRRHMTIISASNTTNLPPEVVFDYVSDFRWMPDWVFGLHTVEPVGAQSMGLGTEFTGKGKIGPIGMTGTGRITEWQPNRFFTAELFTNNGIKASCTFTLTPIEPELTHVDITVGYTFPGGLTGKLIQRAIEPLLGSGIRSSVRTLRRRCLSASC